MPQRSWSGASLAEYGGDGDALGSIAGAFNRSSHGGTSNPEEWRAKVNSELVCFAWDNLCGSIVQQVGMQCWAVPCPLSDSRASLGTSNPHEEVPGLMSFLSA